MENSKKQRLLLTQGISGSGKSFFAAQLVNSDKTFENSNRDDIRTSLCCNREIWTRSREFEELVTKIQEVTVKEILKVGKSCVVSDTNLNPRTVRKWQEIAAELNADFEINDSFLSVPLQTCLERDAARVHPVGEAVIRRQFGQAYEIIIVSAREDKFCDVTENWLVKHEIPYKFLRMRKFGDYRKDSVVKEEIYRELVKNYYIELVLDDRKNLIQHLRKLGLNVWEVNEGDF